MIDDHDTKVLLLDRNYLNCLISYIKARKLKCWNLVDTTDIRLNDMSDAGLIAYHHEYKNKFINEPFIRSYLKELGVNKSVILNYETLVSWNTVNNQLQGLRELINSLFESDILGQIKKSIKVKYFKQDLGSNANFRQRLNRLLLDDELSSN